MLRLGASRTRAGRVRPRPRRAPPRPRRGGPARAARGRARGARCRSRPAGPRAPRAARSAWRACSSAFTGRRCAGAPGRATRSSSRRRRRSPCSSAIANASFRRAIASSGLPSRNSSPPRLFSSRPTLMRSVSSSYCAFARSAYVRASTQWPSRSAISDAWKYASPSARASSIDSASSSARVDVLARRLVVALAAVAARAPGEDVRAQQVGRQRRAVDAARAPRRRARSRSRCSRSGSGATPRRKSTSARSRSENDGPSTRPRACSSSSIAGADLAAVHARPGLARRARAPGARRRRWRRRPRARPCTRRSRRRSRAARTSASARASIASARARSSLETPLARNVASTPSRAASHSTVSRVGRVLPRSICEMYSFENRSPARSLCVSPAETRSWRRRSPRRDPRGTRGWSRACRLVTSCRSMPARRREVQSLDGTSRGKRAWLGRSAVKQSLQNASHAYLTEPESAPTVGTPCTAAGRPEVMQGERRGT